MKIRNFRRKLFDANRPVPETITTQLIEALMGLPESPKNDYLKSTMLDKFVSNDTAPPSVRVQRAVNKWLAVERNNEATSTRLHITHPEFNILPGVEFRTFVEKCREVITSIIGDTPPDEAFIGSFSGGASTSRARTESYPASKYLGRAHVTERARSVFEDSVLEMPGWRVYMDGLHLETVLGNVMFTVPKNTEIDRVAAKEPDINMFLQKGAGNFIRKCLRRHGINLNDQTRNKHLAYEGSITGLLMTLDLSSASDSVTRSLVENLLPEVWFVHLDSIRSEYTLLVDGTIHKNEMFSSMGNGFTFELESLLFYAITRTVAYFEGISGVISVYGDDIIAPSALFNSLTFVLEYCGFEVNASKSFASGDFRESCGGHFINGRDVTPFYIRKPLSKLTDVIHIANALRNWSINEDSCNDFEIYPIWVMLLSFIPKNLWGGREYSSITQVVSPHRPKAQLAPRKGVVDVSCENGFIHWLNVTWARKSPGDIETSTFTVDVPMYRVRPAVMSNFKPRLLDYFVEEVNDAE